MLLFGRDAKARNSGRHLSFANLASLTALFIALGGAGAYATGLIGSKDIKSNAIKSRHIAPHQVKASDIQAGLLGGDAGSTETGPTPPSGPANFDTDHVVGLTLTRPSRIVAIGTSTISVGCNSGTCEIDTGLYANDQGIPGTEHNLMASSAASENPDIRAVSDVLPAGTYKVRLGYTASGDLINIATGVNADFVAFTVPAG